MNIRPAPTLTLITYPSNQENIKNRKIEVHTWRLRACVVATLRKIEAPYLLRKIFDIKTSGIFIHDNIEAQNPG